MIAQRGIEEDHLCCEQNRLTVIHLLFVRIFASRRVMPVICHAYFEHR